MINVLTHFGDFGDVSRTNLFHGDVGLAVGWCCVGGRPQFVGIVTIGAGASSTVASMGVSLVLVVLALSSATECPGGCRGVLRVSVCIGVD
jgi:hypothetical protein